MQTLSVTQVSKNPEDGVIITYAPDDAVDPAELERLLSIYHDGIAWFHRLLQRAGKCVWRWTV